MPIQVINDPYRHGNQNQQQGNGLLSQLGQGLGRGLTRFAENKLQQIEQRNAYHDISSRLQGVGLSPQEADYVATLPPQYQVPLLQQLGMGRQQQPQDQFQQQMQQPAMQPGPEQQQEAQQMVQQQRPDFLQKIGKSAPSSSGVTPAQERAERHKINQETKGVYEQTFKEAKAAAASDKRLNRMEQLIKKGNLPSAGWGSLLKGLSKGIFGHGIDLSYLTHADAQEFDKLSTDFLKDAKAIFGARLTDTDLINFLKTVPSLSQTNEGKLRVINNLKAANAAAKTREDVMKRIISLNGGQRPADLELLIEEFSGPELDKLAEQFKEENIPSVENSPSFQLGGKKQSFAEEIESFRKNPSLRKLFFQQRD